MWWSDYKPCRRASALREKNGARLGIWRTRLNQMCPIEYLQKTGEEKKILVMALKQCRENERHSTVL